MRIVKIWNKKVFNALLALALITLVVNTYTLLTFVRRVAINGIEEGVPRKTKAKVVYDKTVPTIRFKVRRSSEPHGSHTAYLQKECCDDNLVILVGEEGPVDIAQGIWTKYEEALRKKGGRGVDKGALQQPYSAFKLQRHLFRNSNRYVFSPSFKSEAYLRGLWGSLEKWPFSDSLRLGQLRHILEISQEAKIINASCPGRGTQLKLELELEGGQGALWKPEWYPRGVQLEGVAYTGKDRHFGEIAAFYLNLLLGYNNAPIVVGRRIHLGKEVLPVATQELQRTFFINGSSTCFYGVCHYCSRNDPACASSGEMEGALILWMKTKFHSIQHPWRRNYLKKKARWEMDPNYCGDKIKGQLGMEMILDIVGVAVFDFLIGNGDRHTLEVRGKERAPEEEETPSSSSSSHSNRILLLDNGKSFGAPDEDYLDILAPLYQCCTIRGSLHAELRRFDGLVGSWMDVLSKGDSLYPLLSQGNLDALDRRVKIVLATVEYCKEVKKGGDNARGFY